MDFPVWTLSLYWAAAMPAMAWQISGKVTDRGGTPLAQANVCVEGGANCVTTGATGAFTLTGTTGLARPAAGLSARDFELEQRAGKLFLMAPRALSGRLAWFDDAGRLLAQADVDLRGGPNRLETPPDAAGPGPRLLRFTQGNLQVTWRTVRGPSGGVFLSSVDPGRLAPAKIADAGAVLTASKSGFQDRKYYAADPVKDTTAWILLAATGDDSTYKLGGSSYPAAAVPPNEMVGRATFWNCTGCYGGKKAAQLLGHSATGKGTITFNQVYAPADGDYDVTWSYFCGINDNNGDRDCGGDKTLLTASGCRPGILVINGAELPKTYQFQCFSTPWAIGHFTTFSLPLKAGNNSIKMYSQTADCPDLDRIIVKDGR